MAVRIQDIARDDLAARDPAFAPVLRFVAAGADAAADPTLFDCLLDRLQIFAPSRDGAPYLHCGRRSTTGELFGAAVAEALIGKPGLAHDAFERVVQPAYRAVHLTGKPVSQRVSAVLEVHGQRRLVAYYRLVFPLAMGSNRLTGCMTRFC